jgi:superfamily I DNA/RNA helicase/mRNA-degrading endonuclease RelE of RelBE toxin-antitoxin system
MSFELIHKPTFTNQLLAIPNDQIGLILDKIERILRQDPSPHDKLKKKLHGYKGNVYRLRCGDYRIIYTYGDGWVTLLGVDNRKDIYKGERLMAEAPDVSIGDLSNADALLLPVTQPAYSPKRDDTQTTIEDELPVTIDDDLLRRLRVPEAYFQTLCACRTVDDLVAADVPDLMRDRVFDCVTSPDFDRVLQEPDYVTGEVDDLLRFKEGELMGFLLKLSPEQEKLVSWAVNAAGPTLVKGGPGTGKSTVALHRVRAMLKSLHASGVTNPRLLFTTYTNALVAFSRQLLESLLGDDMRYVDVRTADSLAMWIVGSDSGGPRIASNEELRQAMTRAIASARFDGTTQEQAALRRTVQRLGVEYLTEEIAGVIEARQLRMLTAYLAATRQGRKHPLGAIQRTAIWRVREGFLQALAEMQRQTWQQVHARALELVEGSCGPERYDAVIVDEAQDLDPSVLRMLVELCRAPNRIFVTADANQSIYGSGFRWTDVHTSLQFQGRTGILRANFRSTREIGEAAQSYLGEGMLDDEEVERAYAHSGLLPAVRTVRGGRGEESELLARFLPAAAREWRLGLGACAVLCPTERAGKSVAADLAARGLNATFMTGRELDLARRCIKVITLKSAKGLEFPVVALAGFPSGAYPPLRADIPGEQRDEVLPRERRTIFVGMTRAMRALLVVIPAATISPLLTGFDSAYWNLG